MCNASAVLYSQNNFLYIKIAVIYNANAVLYIINTILHFKITVIINSSAVLYTKMNFYRLKLLFYLMQVLFYSISFNLTFELKTKMK